MTALTLAHSATRSTARRRRGRVVEVISRPFT